MSVAEPPAAAAPDWRKINFVLVKRRGLGLSGAAVAERSGTTAQNVSRIERGWHTPSAKLAPRLARALKCDPEELVAAIEAFRNALRGRKPKKGTRGRPRTTNARK